MGWCCRPVDWGRPTCLNMTIVIIMIILLVEIMMMRMVMILALGDHKKGFGHSIIALTIFNLEHKDIVSKKKAQIFRSLKLWRAKFMLSKSLLQLKSAI